MISGEVIQSSRSQVTTYSALACQTLRFSLAGGANAKGEDSSEKNTTGV